MPEPVADRLERHSPIEPPRTRFPSQIVEVQVDRSELTLTLAREQRRPDLPLSTVWPVLGAGHELGRVPVRGVPPICHARLNDPTRALSILEQRGDWLQSEFNDQQYGVRRAYVQSKLVRRESSTADLNSGAPTSRVTDAVKTEQQTAAQPPSGVAEEPIVSRPEITAVRPGRTVTDTVSGLYL